MSWSIQLLYPGVDTGKIRRMAAQEPAVLTYSTMALCASNLAHAKEDGMIGAHVPLTKVLLAIERANTELREILKGQGYSRQEIDTAFDVATGRCHVPPHD